MKTVILANRSCFPSALLLRNEIAERLGKKFYVYREPPRNTGRVILRYGNSMTGNFRDTLFNPPEFIRLASNKYRFSKLMEAEKINSPVYRTDTPSDSDFPVMIRTTLTSSGGRGILIAKNREEFSRKFNKGYWTPFVNTSLEARAHVFIENGKPSIARIFKKIYNGDGPEEEFPIRTSSNYHFSIREDMSSWKKGTEFCLALGEVLAKQGASFFSLDIGFCKDTKQYIVFEANSGSGLNSITAGMYADFLVNQGAFG